LYKEIQPFSKAPNFPPDFFRRPNLTNHYENVFILKGLRNSVNKLLLIKAVPMKKYLLPVS
jgi:hypothetical protein